MLLLSQGGVELNGEGAALLAAAYNLAQGPEGTTLSPAQCKIVDVDFLASYWLVTGDFHNWVLLNLHS